MASADSASPEVATSIDALQHAVEAAQRHVVEADDRHAVEVLEPGAQRDELQQVGDDVHVDAFAVRRFDEAEHLDVLLERQRHVEVIDLLLADDLVGIGSMPSSGSPR